jgi:SAM-dependent methyltransferase
MSVGWLFSILVCPVCREPLSFEADGADGDGYLVHASASSCLEAYPVINGVPRLLSGRYRSEIAKRHADWFQRTPRRMATWSRWRSAGGGDSVVEGFDFEWAHFRRVQTTEQRRVFAMYFDAVPAGAFSPDAVVLDAGSGAGRWAAEVAARGPRVVALDLGSSIDVTRANTDPERVACVQADLRDVPFKDEAFDWAYSLGVLHHLDDASGPLARIVRSVRPAGLVLIYLYYALDNRGLAFRAVYAAVNAARRVTSRLPRPVALVFSSVAAALIYWPLATIARLLESVGVRGIAAALPLAAYRHSSFETMRNDSLDRFGTRLENRFTRQQVTRLMEGAGLEGVRVADTLPFWHATGRRSDRPSSADGGGDAP